MASSVIVRLGGPDALLRFQDRRRDLAPLLKGIGGLVVDQGRKAFVEQKLGDTVWPERYPKQKEPFINIAPVVFQAGLGNKPSSGDFQRRPALGGVTSPLAQSLTYSVSGNTVEAGSGFPWSGLFNFGGVGKIAITDTTRATLAEWLFGSGNTLSGQERHIGKKAKYRTKERTFETPGTRIEYAQKLAFVFNRDELSQRTYARPFIGFTDQTLEDVTKLIAEHFDGDVVSGAAA